MYTQSLKNDRLDSSKIPPAGSVRMVVNQIESDPNGSRQLPLSRKIASVVTHSLLDDAKTLTEPIQVEESSRSEMPPASNPEDGGEESVSPDEEVAMKKWSMATAVRVGLWVRKWLRNGEERADGAAGGNLTSLIEQTPEEELEQPVQPKKTPAHYLKKIWHGTIEKGDNWFYYWSGLLTVGYVYNLLFIVCRCSFDELQKANPQLWFALDYLFDAINLIDILLHFKIGYLEEGIVVTDHKKLARNYIKSKTFRYDMISIIPTDVMYLALKDGAIWVRANRLFRYHRVERFFVQVESRTSFPNLIRILKLVTYIFVIFHWNGCFYFILSRVIGFNQDQWVFRYDRVVDPVICDKIDPNNSRNCLEAHVIKFSNLTKQYVFSLYWSALILTTIGEQQAPVTNWEHAFVIFDILVGLLIFASIVGNVGTMISNMNAQKAEFQESMDGAKTYMRNRAVTKTLNRKTVAWFDYMWSQKQAFDEESVLHQLPTKLKAELAIQVHLQTLQQVHIFQNCEPGLLVELVLKLKLQIMNPGDFICRKGDVGKEMYIVKRGCLNVVSEDGKKVFVTLKEGSVFGELSVLDIPGNKTGNRRSASIRSVGYSDLFALTKDDLWQALKEYPQAKTVLVEEGKAMLRKNNLLDEEAANFEIPGGDIRERFEVIDKKLKAANEEISHMYANFITESNQLKRMTRELEKKTEALEQKLLEKYKKKQ